MDEMCIHKQTRFEGDHENVATQALVPMVVAVSESWKIPFVTILSYQHHDRSRESKEGGLVRPHVVRVRAVSSACDGLSQIAVK